MSKRTVYLVLAVALLLTLGVSVASAAPPRQEEIYTVKLGDTLWDLAEKYLGNGFAYKAIVAATREKAMEDETFTYIVEPGLIHPGQKFWIPSAEEATAYLEAIRIGGVVDALGIWSGVEARSFDAAVAPFTEETGTQIAWEGTRDLPTVLAIRVAAGNPPDIAILPNPGQMVEFAKTGDLVALDTFMDMEQLKSDYAQSWLDLGSYEGKLYAFFYKAAVKGLVWYSPAAFEAKGYTVPTTWDELIALSDQIVADGGVPWCLGIESGAASGWPATDWIEDIMLRTAGPDVYDKWVDHTIPWTDAAIKSAWEKFGQIARNEAYVYGGTTGVLTINFGDSPAPLFDDPPGCYMHRQASFITGFPAFEGQDYAFFPFPSIDPAYGTPALGAADLVVMFNDTPQARALMEYLATPGPQEIWAGRGGFLSPNKRVSLDAYPTATDRAMAQALTGAEVFRFDGSDLMPAAVGSGTFWTGTLDYVGGVDLDTVLATIEASAVDAYK